MNKIKHLKICNTIPDFPYTDDSFNSYNDYEKFCYLKTEQDKIKADYKNVTTKEYVDLKDAETLKESKDYTDVKPTIILVDTKGKTATKETILKWGKDVSVWYNSEIGNKYELKEGFLVILPVIIEGSSDKVGIIGKVIQITPGIIQVQGYLIIKDYTGIESSGSSDSIFNVEIEKDGFGNYTADYNDNDINNARNSGKMVQAKYFDSQTKETYTYYYSNMKSDRRPTFNRTYIDNDGIVNQVIIAVDNKKKATVEIRKAGI